MLSRYSNIDFVLQLPYSDGMALILKAFEKRQEENMFRLYTSAYPHFSEDKFKTWEEFYVKPNVNTQPIKLQSVDEILLSVKETLRINKEGRE